jgi:hypothetical protein
MADKDTPKQSPTVPNSESSTDRKYNVGIGDNTGGITNRPLDEEVENQNALPDRGLSQADELVRSDEDIER